MISGWTEDHEELRDTVRRLLTAHAGPEARRAAMEAGTWNRALWERLCDLGLADLTTSEENEGAAMGPVELNVVMEELGRFLYIGPYLSSVVLAGGILARLDDPAASALLASLADGSVTATLAVGDRAGALDAGAVTSTVDSEGRITGAKEFVVDGQTADVIVVAARDAKGVGLFAVRREDVTVDPEPLLDVTRAFARVVLDAAPAQRLGGDAAGAIAAIADLAAILLAAEQAGGAAAALEMTVEYAKIRIQFDRQIGSFQAVKHRCADVAVAVESARSAAFFAAALLADRDPESHIAASVAQAWCAHTFTEAAKTAIQLHGGIGYTWEHDAHLYLKRAKTDELIFGTPTEHRERIAQLAGI